MQKKRDLTQQLICEQAIEFFENKFFKQKEKKRKIQESKEEKRECHLIENAHFNNFEVIGSGAFGKIFSAQKSGKKYAIKKGKKKSQNIKSLFHNSF